MQIPNAFEVGTDETQQRVLYTLDRHGLLLWRRHGAEAISLELACFDSNVLGLPLVVPDFVFAILE